MNELLERNMRGLIYLVDDDAPFAKSLSNVLHLGGYEVKAFSGVSALLESPLSNRAVVVCDMRMPNETGLDLQEAFKRLGIHLPIIFISGESTVNQAVSALKGGAVDFLTKPFEPEKLFKVIEDTFDAFDKKEKSIEAFKVLSPREYEAFQFFVKGFGNAFVAEKMNVKVATVKEFKTNIFKKLNVNNISELIDRFRG